MNKKTLQITTGAAVIAIFAVMILLNRQTGGLFEEVFMFLYPIPMLAFSVQYGWKRSMPVLFAMAFFSFLFGSFTTVFYAVSEALIGLVFGECLYSKVDMTKTMFAVMFLSVIANVLNTVVFAGLFGIDLHQEIVEMQNIMNEMVAKTGVVLPETVLSENYLMQMMVIAMVLLGIVQGFVIFRLSILVLRRLRFPIQQPKSVYLYFPPKWTGYLAFLLFWIYNLTFGKPLENEILQNAIQCGGICGDLYLVFFGLVAATLFIRTRMSHAGGLCILVCIFGYFAFSSIFMLVGLFYIVTGWHQSVAEQCFGKDAIANTKKDLQV